MDGAVRRIGNAKAPPGAALAFQWWRGCEIPACEGMTSGALADYEYRAVGVAHHFGSG
jgi:hypothetical protein